MSFDEARAIDLIVAGGRCVTCEARALLDDTEAP